MASGIVSWKDKAERASRALARVREYTEDAVVNARYDGETAIAGGLAGAVRGAFEGTGKDYSIPGPGGIRVQPEMVAGGAALALAFAKPDKTPGAGVARDLHAIGSGFLAYGFGVQAQKFMAEKSAKKVSGQ